ncbi:cytidylate kinase family protein [Candidatus Gottesmanbacteria bacterium]|nr:cytidylate kinase family protein [Candidatus Gottesmanbacteria bacterium]
MQSVSPKWRNITVSGRAANGATTLSRLLADKLGWKLINPGEMYRDYAKKNNIPLEKTDLSEDTYHLDLDKFIIEKLRQENHLIIESWLSGFDAREIPGVFKIFVTCSNDAVRVDRLVNRDNMTIDEAIKHMRTREEENLKKWEKLYHTRDFWDPKLYDLIIDTYKNGPTETLEIALNTIGFHSKK